MRLVYKANPTVEVKVGDSVYLDGQPWTVEFFRPPRSAASEGRVSLGHDDLDGTMTREYYVSVIGAEWIEREDRKDRQVIYVYRSTYVNFRQFLSAVLACAVDEPSVVTLVEDLIAVYKMRAHDPRVGYHTTTIDTVNGLTGGQCKIEQS
jgi:hypothetical protein